MGFTFFKPDFVIPVSDTQAYRQFGNSVVVPLVFDVAKSLIGALDNNLGAGLERRREQTAIVFPAPVNSKEGLV